MKDGMKNTQVETGAAGKDTNRKRTPDWVWDERGIIKKGWVALPHLLPRNLAAIGMSPQEFALVMGLMSHKGDGDPWLANKTMARYLGMSVRGVQKIISGCDGRWFNRLSRKSKDGRVLSNKFDLTPLIDVLEALAAGREVEPRPKRALSSKRAKANGTKAEGTKDNLPEDIPEGGAAVTDVPEIDLALLTLDAIDGWKTSLRRAIASTYVEKIEAEKRPVLEDQREQLARRFADGLTPEQLQATAAKFPKDKLARMLAKDPTISFWQFASAVVNEHAPFLDASWSGVANEDGAATPRCA